MARKAEKIAREARIACEKWRGYFKQNIDLYHLMYNFVLGSQWTDDEEQEMIKTYRKVPLASNKLATMANALLGEQQQNTPQLEVVPMENCTAETAKLREVIIKEIMFSTDATISYQVAASQAAIGGFGAFLIGTDYVHEKSFDQNIVYRHFKDATRCFFDIGAERVNKTDGMHCGYLSRISWQKLADLYGKDVASNIKESSNITQTEEEIALATDPDEATDPFNWSDGDGTTIIDFFKRRYEKDTLYKLSNGRILNQEEMDELIDRSIKINELMAAESAIDTIDSALAPEAPMSPSPEIIEGTPGVPDAGVPVQAASEILQNQSNAPELPDDEFGIKGLYKPQAVEKEGVEKVQEDNVITLWDEGVPVRIEEKKAHKRYKIMHYRICGEYVLDKSEFPSDQLPLVFVDNNSYYDKKGKQITRSFFGDCRDTQRYINYLRTQSAYILKVSRYDQWIGSKKNVASPDTRQVWTDPSNTQGLLVYDESPSGAKPEQIRPPELSASLFQQYQLAVEDLYTSTGLYPARLGQAGNEISGAAIDARTRQGSYPTFVYFNSINRAIATGGEIVNEMIPKVYDSERAMTLMMPDVGIKNIVINRQVDDYGEMIENDIRKGTYQVRLKPGPSYEGQKEQALVSLREILQANPQTFSLVADLYAENLPLSNTIEIKNRLKTLVPPQIIEAGKTGQMPPPQPPQPTPEEQMIQAQQQYMQKDFEIRQQEVEIKKAKLAQEYEVKLQELEAERAKAAAELQEQELKFAAEIDRTNVKEQIAHADNLVKILTHNIKK